MQCVPDVPPSPEGDKPGCNCTDAEPVSLTTGFFTYDKVDHSLSDVIPITLTRTYRQGDTVSRAFGIGTTHNYEIFLAGDTSAFAYKQLILPDGGRIHFARTSPGTGYLDAVFEHSSTPTEYLGAIITWSETGWLLSLRDGTSYFFRPTGSLEFIEDRHGNLLELRRNSNGTIGVIVSPHGRWVSFTYDSSNRATQVRDNAGRAVSYAYNAGGRLVSVTDANGGVTSYTYDAAGRLSTITTPRGHTLLTNTYDSNGRLIHQLLADGSTYQLEYTLDGSARVIEARVTDPRGFVRRTTFNANGYVTSDSHAFGTPQEQTVTYNRAPSTNLLLSQTDELGRTTSFTYDSLGNLVSVTRAAGTGDAATRSFTYEATYNQPTSVTDPLNHTVSLLRDSLGNVTSITDPLGNSTELTYNAAGQPLTITDPVSHTTQFSYLWGDLSTISDPHGNTTRVFIDDAGDLAALGDALGNWTLYDYDNLNHLTAITDALGGTTALAYDPNGNLASVTDARGGATSYAYDSMDRRISRADPLAASESYAYDPMGNLTSHTDRRGVTSAFSYDGLGRRTFAGFGASGGQYESTISYAWDGGDRLAQVTDSIAGVITRSYDNLDRLTSESTPQGSISYAYDPAGRRTAMTVAGQSTVNYSWDNANRLTGITQGTSSVSFSYDQASRRASLTLPNGIVAAYTYDSASRLTGMSWSLGGTSLGDLNYAYDGGGRIVKRLGSLATTGLPQAVPAATYDLANGLTNWNGTPLSHDANGNMLGDGSNSYAWNARNQLAALNGANLGVFMYDGLGRRTAKSIDGVTKQFLHDGLNPVQELSSSGTPIANLLTGLSIDEFFMRTDAAGARSYLTDILGSAVALSDSGGAIATTYSYEPFGKAIASGVSSANPFQFTGRENDGAGLHYYRARYYSPAINRFISADPLEGSVGGNSYHYAEDRPTSLLDPLGLYGTTNCSLYPNLCRQFPDPTDAPYECVVAPFACNNFPKHLPVSDCIRQCLQDEYPVFNPTPICELPKPIGLPENATIHMFCITRCLQNPENPFDPHGPPLPDAPNS
jgi:RHS repeat-associated protein